MAASQVGLEAIYLMESGYGFVGGQGGRVALDKVRDGLWLGELDRGREGEAGCDLYILSVTCWSKWWQLAVSRDGLAST